MNQNDATSLILRQHGSVIYQECWARAQQREGQSKLACPPPGTRPLFWVLGLIAEVQVTRHVSKVAARSDLVGTLLSFVSCWK